MKKRIAIVDGIRTPFCKAMGAFRHQKADDLGAFVVREMLNRVPLKNDEYDELLFGNVIAPSDAYNIGRVIAIKGGLADSVPAISVSRNCASGMESVVIGVERFLTGRAQRALVVGGAESMTHVPIQFNEKARDFFWNLSKARSFGATFKEALKFRPSMLSPVVPAINDPLCGLTMGQTAELVAQDFGISREAQDQFALESQRRSAHAQKNGFFADEILPILNKKGELQDFDDGVRGDQTLEQLAKLRPAFEKLTGTVTAGNASQVTDGACALVLMPEDEVNKLGIKPLGWITGYTFAGLQPQRMGLGPAYATAKILKETGKKLSDFDLIEINEAFAAQVLAVRAALNSAEFCKEKLGLNEPVGLIDLEKLNVNGGAIALGHPLGASGARIILTLLHALKARGGGQGLATLCVGGGQGEAVSVEVL